MKKIYYFIIFLAFFACEKENGSAPIAVFDAVSYPIKNFQYVLDATSSFSTNGGDLAYRWDLNGDGFWDTDWMNTPYCSSFFTFEYTGLIYLEVKDELGEVMKIGRTIPYLHSNTFRGPYEPSTELNYKTCDYWLSLKGPDLILYSWAVENILLPNGEGVYNFNTATDQLRYGSLVTWEKANSIMDDTYKLPPLEAWMDMVDLFGTPQFATYNLFSDQTYSLSLTSAGLFLDDNIFESEFGYYWTSTEIDDDHAYAVKIHSYGDILEYVALPKNYGATVRLYYGIINNEYLKK